MSSPSCTKRCSGAASARRSRWANETEPRGEHVLVVDAAPDRPPRPAADVRAAISRLVAAGVGLRDATTAVEVQLGVAHRVAYAAALELRGTAEAKRTVG